LVREHAQTVARIRLPLVSEPAALGSAR
jgi:hypothetical protein